MTISDTVKTLDPAGLSDDELLGFRVRLDAELARRV